MQGRTEAPLPVRLPATLSADRAGTGLPEFRQQQIGLLQFRFAQPWKRCPRLRDVARPDESAVRLIQGRRRIRTQRQLAARSRHGFVGQVRLNVQCDGA
jgi:hypothetical protein